MRLAAALCAGLLLGGCAGSKQPDDMAYVISLSVDRLETGELEIAAQAPTIVGGGEQGQGESEYTFMSAVGKSFGEALDVLEAASQRALNLTQMKTVIVSRELAEEPGFRDVLDDIQLTPRIYGDARLVVSLNPARELLMAQKAVIGMRLARSVEAAIRHYQEHGYAPEAGLADAYFRMHSAYSDPVGILAATAEGEETEYLPEGRLGDAYPGRLPRTGENRNEYCGCALFAGGKMVGMLTGQEEEMRGLVSGEVKKTGWAGGGETAEMRVTKRKVSVDLTGEEPGIEIYLRLRMEMVGKGPGKERAAREMEAEIRSVIQKCQRLGTEPFGLAEIAAGQFLTMDDWIGYDWHERFARAEARVRVEVE